jgi:mannose/cellobiose epimerase-like protein (N-acyl-D-glucosamine 2-epimerase family)
VGWDDRLGGLRYTVDWDGSPANPDRYWWTLAEGIGASSYLGRLTGEPRYERWYRTFWDFASEHFVDHRRGGWYAQLDASNNRTSGPWHGKPDLYHVLQSAVLPLVAPSPSVARALLDDAARPMSPSSQADDTGC